MQRSLEIIHIAALVFAVLISVPSAHADSAADRKEAGQLCTEGSVAMDRHDFATALERFERANEIYPSANIRYDIGVAQFRLGRFAEAVDAFEEFLAAAPTPRSDARAFAAARLAELSSQVAHLELVVVPADAVVSLDDRRLRLPRATGVPVMPGVHRVLAEKSGYASSTERLYVGPGERTRVELTLRPTALPVLATNHPVVSPSVVQLSSRDRRVAPRERNAALILGAGGLAALAGGLGAGIVADQISRELTHDSELRRPFDSHRESDGKSAQAAEGALLGIGTAAAVTGLILYLTARQRQRAVGRSK